MATENGGYSRKRRILDAAEKLFSRHGFDGVTLRKIADLAGVDVALTNYHFGSKRALFETVFMRRAKYINKIRHKVLDECIAEAGDQPPQLEALIEAYLRPLSEAHQNADEGWRYYFALIAMVNNSAEWGGILMTDNFDLFINRFIDALRLALPEADEEALYWGYHYLSGALTLTFAETGRLDKLSNGLVSSSDVATGYAHMAPFIAAGFKAICAHPK